MLGRWLSEGSFGEPRITCTRGEDVKPYAFLFEVSPPHLWTFDVRLDRPGGKFLCDGLIFDVPPPPDDGGGGGLPDDEDDGGLLLTMAPSLSPEVSKKDPGIELP